MTAGPESEAARRRPTLEGVAARAGVSRGTASRVLTGSPNVSDVTAARVREAAAELGYRPNLSARSLVTGRTGLVGLVVNEREDRAFNDPFFAQVARGAIAGLAGTDYALVVTMVATRRQRDQLTELSATRLDGMLVVSNHDDAHLAEQLAAAGADAVFAGRTVDLTETTALSWVDCDSLSGSQEAVRHLLTRGRTRVATITGALDMAAGRDRLEGWRRALDAAGLAPDDSLVARGDFDPARAGRAMRHLLAERADLDAVFAASDQMAIAAARVLRERGRRVPEDVAVVGFDDNPAAAEHDPPLTTVHQDVERLGRRMTQVLLARFQGHRDVVHEVLPVQLVVRDSS